MVGLRKSKKDLKLIYQEFLKIFYNFKFIAFYGTLLGICRNKDFIENDDDIDFLLSKNELNNFEEKLNQQNNFIFKKLKKSYSDDILLIQCYFNNIGPIDVYFYSEENNDILIPWDGNLLYSKTEIFPLKEITFHNCQIFIPHNFTNVLIQTYGKNWKIPIDKSKYKWTQINSVRKKPIKLNLINKNLLKLKI
jgi:phosphorylcholine metabolism protein LicD